MRDDGVSVKGSDDSVRMSNEDAGGPIFKLSCD